MTTPRKETHMTYLNLILVEDDLNAIEALLPQAAERQWEASPVPRPVDQADRRSVGGSPSDPTADVALDPRRMAVRDALNEAETARRVLAQAVERLHRARRELERKIAWYDGNNPGS